MSYELGVSGKGKIAGIRDLSDAEYADYKRASDILLGFAKDQRLYTIVCLNYDDFLKTLEKYAKMYANNPRGLNWIVLDRMILNINRLILNYLSSVRTFLDHNETKLKKKYGTQSVRYQRFRNACAEVHDSSFSYRFLSKLRNYSQHCEMPLGILTLQSEEYPPGSGHVSHSLEIKFNRDELLQYQVWGSKLAREVSMQPSEFGIRPHFAEMMSCVKKINLTLIQDDIPELRKSAKYINQLISPAKGKEGVPCILKLLHISDDKKNLKLQITNIPLHLVKLVLDIERQQQASE